DDHSRTLPRGQATQVGQAVLGDDHVHIVLGVVYVGDHGHDGRDGAVLGHRLGHEDRQVGVAGKVARATDAVHHVRAVDVRGVDVAVDVALERRVDGDQAQAADDLGVVGHLLRTQHQTRLVVLDVAQHALVGGLGEGDGGGRGEAQAAAVQQLDGAVLQDLGVHLEVVEGRVDQAS